MAFQYSTYLLPLLGAGLVSAGLAFYATRKRTIPGALFFALMMLGVTEWAFGYALEIAGANLPTKVFWGEAQYLGIVTAPLAWLGFALHYAGAEHWVTRRHVIPALIVPLLTLAAVFTTPAYGLIWSHITLDASGPFLALQVTHGPWFWVHTAYSYLLVLLGSILLVRKIAGGQTLQRGQAAAVLAAVLIPWVGNAIYLSGLNPWPPLDLTPFAFTLTGVALALGVFRFRLLDLAPVARATVIDNMADGMIVLDPQNRVVDLNPAAERILGVPARQVIAQPADKYLAAWPHLVKRFRDTLLAQEVISLGEGAARRDFELRISPLADRQQRPVGRIVLVHDITEHRRAQTELLNYQFRLETQNLELRKLTRAVEQSASAVIITDLSGRIEYVNPSFEQITGYPAAEARGQNPRLLSSGEQTRAFYHDLWQTIQAGRPWHGEFHNRRKDGTLYWAQSTIAPIHDAEGQVTHFVAVQEDVSARKQGEAAVRRHVELLTGLHQLTLDLLNSPDVETLLPVVVTQATQLLQATQGELMLIDGDALVLRARVAQLGAPAQALRERQGRGAAPLAWQAFDSRQPAVAGLRDEPVALALPVLAAGQCHGVLTLRRDEPGVRYDTEQVQFGMLLAQITAMVLNTAQLHTSLREANQLKSRLLANISHDVRTPLSAILGYTDMLQVGVYGAISDQQRATLTEIVFSTNTLLGYVNNLVGQAEIESGRLMLNPRPFPAASLIDGLEASARLLVKAKGLALTSEIAPELPATLVGDIYRLHQIVLNLVSNAINFTEQGSIRLRLYPPDPAHWAIEVTDTGPGIAPEAQAHIFNAFWQGEADSLRKPQHGSGLGLSIVSELTTLMGGRVLLDSALGRGSTFTVVLPYLAVPVAS